MTSTLSTPGFDHQRLSEKGLSSEEARRRLAVYGFNEPISKRRAVPMLQFLRLFANPLVIILLIASLISAITGDVVEAVIIIVIVLLAEGDRQTSGRHSELRQHRHSVQR